MPHGRTLLPIALLLAGCGAYPSVTASSPSPAGAAVVCYATDLEAKGYKVLRIDRQTGWLEAQKGGPAQSADVTVLREGTQIVVQGHDGGSGSTLTITPTRYVERRNYRGPTFSFEKPTPEGLADARAVAESCGGK